MWFKAFLFGHIVFGCVALVSGGLSALFRKGSKQHTAAGRLFYYSMLSSGLLAILITLLPKHHSYFLQGIGVFTLYYTLGGRRALSYQRTPINTSFEKLLLVLLFSYSLFLLVYPNLKVSGFMLLSTGFGVFGIWRVFRDSRLLLHPEILQKRYLHLHLIRMFTAYASTVTAFLVVNQWLGFLGWFLPGLEVTGIILYWTQKIQVT
ncbi:MAG: hypothetical protein EP332_05230 [Bacteroidetes bacterium]|nr:MAG: hypothetical protein EP332_05230 [Bacteroidota bacterium]